MPLTKQTLTIALLSMLTACFALTGCGQDAPDTPKPKPKAPAEEGQPSVAVPAQGVEVIVVRSFETLPTLGGTEQAPMTTDQVFGAVQPRLVTAPALSDHPYALRCGVLPDGMRVRFWVTRSEAIDEERAVAIAAELAEEFMASAEARFQERVAVSLMGLGKQLEAVSARRAEAQQTLRDYLDLHRGVAETRESRREKAELERDLSVINTQASEIQDLIATLEDMQENGQPWYRREQR